MKRYFNRELMPVLNSDRAGPITPLSTDPQQDSQCSWFARRDRRVRTQRRDRDSAGGDHPPASGFEIAAALTVALTIDCNGMRLVAEFVVLVKASRQTHHLPHSVDNFKAPHIGVRNNHAKTVGTKVERGHRCGTIGVYARNRETIIRRRAHKYADATMGVIFERPPHYTKVIEELTVTRGTAMPDTTIRRISPIEAQAILDQNSRACLIDVRTKVEFEYVGHPVGAVHVPWKEFPDWAENPNFSAAVDTAIDADHDRPLLLICRSGVRSFKAAECLRAHGYTNLSNVEEGFEGAKDDHQHRGNINGWRFHSLPWKQG